MRKMEVLQADLEKFGGTVRGKYLLLDTDAKERYELFFTFYDIEDPPIVGDYILWDEKNCRESPGPIICDIAAYSRNSLKTLCPELDKVEENILADIKRCDPSDDNLHQLRMALDRVRSTKEDLYRELRWALDRALNRADDNLCCLADTLQDNRFRVSRVRTPWRGTHGIMLAEHQYGKYGEPYHRKYDKITGIDVAIVVKKDRTYLLHRYYG